MTGTQFLFGDCELDPAGYRLTRNGVVVQVEPRVLELLVYLVERREKVVTKEELFKQLWAGRFVTESALTRAIYEARRAVGDDSRQQCVIKTVHRRGYQFVAPFTIIAAAELAEPAAPPQVDPAPLGDLLHCEADASAEEALTDSVPPPQVRRRTARSAWFAVAATLLLAVIAILWQRAPQPPERIAIAPFSVDANANDLEWGELALPGLLADVLHERSDVIVFPANRVRQSLQQQGLDANSRELEQVRALRNTFGVDHVLFARLQRDGTQLKLDYRLVGVDGAGQSGHAVGEGAGGLASQLARSVAAKLDIAYRAGIPVRKIGADEFVNEAFARGLQAQLGGDLSDALRYFEACLTSEPDNGWARYEMGNALRHLGRWQDAAAAYTQASAISKEDADPNLAGVAVTGLGLIAWRHGRLEEAEAHFESARAEFAAIDRRANLAAAHGNLGILADNRRDFTRARQHYDTALALYRDEGERAGESAVYSNLAVIDRKLGRLDSAADLQQRAIDLQQKAGLQQMLVFSLAHLSEIERERGRWAAAREALDQALELAEHTGDQVGRADALVARAGLAADLGRHESAADDLRAALHIYDEIGNPAGSARAALRLSRLLQIPDAETALALARSAYEHAKPLDDEALLLEIELALVALDAEALGRILPRLQTLGDHRLLALTFVERARREDHLPHLRTALKHAESAGGERLQADIAVELGRMLLMSGNSEPVEPLLGRAESWQPDYPPTLLLRACYLSHSARAPEARQALARARALLGDEVEPDLSWCPELRRS